MGYESRVPSGETGVRAPLTASNPSVLKDRHFNSEMKAERQPAHSQRFFEGGWRSLEVFGGWLARGVSRWRRRRPRRG